MRILGFEYPDDRYYFLEHDMWCRLLADGRVQVGVTAFGAHLSGEFFMCRPKAPGTMVEQGQTLGIAELSKTIVTIKTPVSGIIDEVNPLLADTPEIINKDPYGLGWLADIRPERWKQDLQKLTHGAALETRAMERMRLERMNFPSE